MPSLSLPTSVPSLSVAGRVYTDTASLIEIIAFTNTTTATSFATPRKGAAASGYTPSGSKAFRVTALRVITSQASSLFPDIGYGDTDIGFSAPAAPTNAVYYTGAAGFGAMGTTVPNAGSVFEIPVDFTIPNGKYPFVSDGSNTAGGTFQLFGYEV